MKFQQQQQNRRISDTKRHSSDFPILCAIWYMIGSVFFFCCFSILLFQFLIHARRSPARTSESQCVCATILKTLYVWLLLGIICTHFIRVILVALPMPPLFTCVCWRHLHTQSDWAELHRRATSNIWFIPYQAIEQKTENLKTIYGLRQAIWAHIIFRAMLTSVCLIRTKNETRCFFLFFIKC